MLKILEIPAHLIQPGDYLGDGDRVSDISFASPKVVMRWTEHMEVDRLYLPNTHQSIRVGDEYINAVIERCETLVFPPKICYCFRFPPDLLVRVIRPDPVVSRT